MTGSTTKRFVCPGWEHGVPCDEEFNVVPGQVVEFRDISAYRVTSDDLAEMTDSELLCKGCTLARLAEVARHG